MSKGAMLVPVDCRISLGNPAAVRNSNECDRIFCWISLNIVWGTGIRWLSQFADCNDKLVADRMQQPNYHEEDVIQLQFLGPMQYLTSFLFSVADCKIEFSIATHLVHKTKAP
jgi:hypothetical protein